MPPNRFESEVESFLEGSHGDRTHIKRADHPRLHHYAGRYWCPRAWAGPGCDTHGQQRHHHLPNFARNLTRSFFETPQKHCNSNDANSMFEQVAGELRATLMGGGEAWPGFEPTYKHTSATRSHWCEGRRRIRRAWTGFEAGPGCGARGRRRGLAGLRADAPSEARVWRSRGRSGPTAPGTPVGPQAARPQPGNARRSSPSEPCAQAGASLPGRSGCGPRCAAPRLRCR